MGKQVTSTSTYAERLVSLIPAEVIAAHLAVHGIVSNVQQQQHDLAVVMSALILLLAIPLYLRKVHGVASKARIVVSMFSFIVWAFNIGVHTVDWFQVVGAYWGAVAIVLWTFLVPVFEISD